MSDPLSVFVKELRESPRRPGRYLLSLSDGRQVVVGAAVVAEAGASRAGSVLSPEAVARLEHEHVLTELVDRALDALARGRRTRRELELRLRRRQATPAQIREALDRVEAAGFLNDEAVAQAEASSRLRRGEAPARVRQQLRRKGVVGSVVNEALRDVMREDGFDEESACRVAAQKRARTLRLDDPVAAQRKLLGFLLRRGYSGGVARRVVRTVLGTAHED